MSNCKINKTEVPPFRWNYVSSLDIYVHQYVGLRFSHGVSLLIQFRINSVIKLVQHFIISYLQFEQLYNQFPHICWAFDSCATKDKQWVDIVMYGDQVDKMTESCHLSSLSERSVGRVPVVGPIWRGGIKISGKISGKLEGLEVFMPKILQPKVVQLKRSLQKSVCFRMKNRRALWPKHFDDVGAAHSDIELFMFPEVSRSEIDYDDLVEHMISNDLAMTSHIGNFKLIIFTSLEQEDNQQYIEGKYYLWGMLKGKGYMGCKSSKGKNTNAEKKRISKSMRSDVSAPSVGHQPITTTQSAVRYNFVPSLSQGCKRPRSKRGRISRTLKEVGEVHNVVADFPGMERRDQESNGVVPVKWHQHQTLGKSRQAKICTNIEQVQVDNDPDSTVIKKKPVMVTDEVDNLSEKDALTSVVGGDIMKDGMTNRGSPSPDLAEEVTINTETKEAEQRSWDSNMEIDEPSDSSAINVKETEVENRSWDSDMEIDEPIDDVVKDDVELQPQSNVSQAMDAEVPNPLIKACLTPFLKSEEFPVQEVPNPVIDMPRASFSDKNPERILCHTVNVTNQNNFENMILRLNEDSTDDVELQPQSYVSQAMDAEIKACLTPSLKSEEFSDKTPETSLCHTVNVTNQNNSENMILRLNEDSTGDGPTVAVPMATTDSKNRSCLIPLLHYKEGLDLHEADPSTPGETISCLDEKPLVTTSNSVADDHKRTELQVKMPGNSEISVGRCQLVAGVDQLECQASDPLPEMESCRTPVLTFEEPGPCSSPTSTLVLEVDEEDDEKESAMKGTEIFNEGSSMITTSSMLNVADHFLETSSDTLRVQVGQYTIKSDLAPILTKILIKYGDIGLGCSMMPETVLEKICKAFQDLEQVSFKEIRSRHLDRLRNLCQLGEALEFDMKWLYDRCEDVEKTVLEISQYSFLKEELAQCKKSIKSLEENVDLNRSIVVKLREENKLIEEEVESLTEHREKLQCEIEDVRFKSRCFIGRSLVDGLF
ncbi:uncharacterized protein LOC141605417 isoform X2 [Silene latifolia]|uniref:uncharacterized protein LOC141605417 isoform X2 n=2 Tax=Silene latifolia TaxID=37657 RepID=UPI003D77FDA1